MRTVKNPFDQSGGLKILKGNLGITTGLLEDLVGNGQPVALLKKALNALESIDNEVDDFISEDVLNLMNEIRKISDGYCHYLKKELRD